MLAWSMVRPALFLLSSTTHCVRISSSNGHIIAGSLERARVHTLPTSFSKDFPHNHCSNIRGITAAFKPVHPRSRHLLLSPSLRRAHCRHVRALSSFEPCSVTDQFSDTFRSQHVTFDMLISTLETLWTFSIAYPTAVSLGKILLQTAPERAPSGSSGPMEAFLRVMREVCFATLSPSHMRFLSICSLST